MSAIAMIGFRGSGKSTLGTWLAEKLGVPFIDTDERVCAHLGFDSVSTAWDQVGEAGWRIAEEQLIPALLAKDAVLALGGGAPMLPKVSGALRMVPLVFNLTASPEATIARIDASSDRPPLSASDLEMRELRLPSYLQLGTYTIDTSGDIDQTKAEILAILR